MKLDELKELKNKYGSLYLASSEESEINNEPIAFYEALRELGFYRVFETYYKDEYQCRQFYCTGFINSDNGYEWLLSSSEDEILNDDLSNLETIQFDLFLDLKGSNVWDRKDRLVKSGNILELLEYSRQQENIDIPDGHKYGIK